MMHFLRSLAVLAALVLASAPAFAADYRTANRDLQGTLYYPDHMFNKPDYYEFSPLVSNRNPHPDAGHGQGWDPEAWNSWWTADKTVQRFFQARIFERRYMRGGQTPVLEVGPVFYELSDIDKRRVLKLLAQNDHVFQQGYGMVELVDWYTREYVGAYTPKGMFLN